MSSHFTPFTLKDISRPGGGFAMLAVDQREAMRLMFAAAGQPKPIADSVLTDFKVAATRILSPYASAVLADKQFCLEQIVEQGAVANSCGLYSGVKMNPQRNVWQWLINLFVAAVVPGWLALLNLWCVHLVAVGTLIVKAPLLPPPQSLVEQRLIFTKPRCH